ncbi:thiamine pyrophosphate-binding protein, partial [Ardenticatena maritima]
MNAHAHANRNTFWASIFVDELARAGVQHAVVAPGSRSTPLALALANTPHIQVVSLLDERGAAFFALGMARATQRPVVVLSSSGTATANFYPAVIEAAQTRVPLIVITADRPHELRQSGANQTIDQLKLYGDHVRWFFDMPLPEATPPDHVLRA